jgi:hypothetical protein
MMPLRGLITTEMVTLFNQLTEKAPHSVTRFKLPSWYFRAVSNSLSNLPVSVRHFPWQRPMLQMRLRVRADCYYSNDGRNVMRNWGIVVAAFYALFVLLFLSYGMVFLAEVGRTIDFSWQTQMREVVGVALIPTAFFVCGQILLMFLSVDTSWRRVKPQRHAKVTAGLVGLMVTILFIAALFAIGMAIWGDNIDIGISAWFEGTWMEELSEGAILISTLAIVLLIWALWGIVFYAFSRRTSDVIEKAVSWLIKGSVLELLVAVPCHVLVRQREWCCAQYISAWGIATGIAVMLLVFGPSALLLYRRKLDDYSR